MTVSDSDNAVMEFEGRHNMATTAAGGKKKPGGAVNKTIVRAAIYPGIGIARVGDSKDGYFIGPEVRFPGPLVPDSFKDASGALKRQAARFRIYGMNDAGEVVAQLDSSNADVTWNVHVANKKAAWYTFDRAMDIPEATPCPRRNRAFVGAARKQLVIDPGPRSIPGAPNLRFPVAYKAAVIYGAVVLLLLFRPSGLARKEV